jgi:hypothetical protein
MRTRIVGIGVALLGVLALAACSGCGKGDKAGVPTSPATTTLGKAAGKPKVPDTFDGSLDVADSTHITGWAWNSSQPDAAVKVDFYDGNTLIGTVTADEFREDLLKDKKGNGKHRFMYHLPDELRDGKEHTIHARYAGTDADLPKSPQKFTATPLPKKG